MWTWTPSEMWSQPIFSENETKTWKSLQKTLPIAGNERVKRRPLDVGINNRWVYGIIWRQISAHPSCPICVTLTAYTVLVVYGNTRNFRLRGPGCCICVASPYRDWTIHHCLAGKWIRSSVTSRDHGASFADDGPCVCAAGAGRSQPQQQQESAVLRQHDSVVRLRWRTNKFDS